MDSEYIESIIRKLDNLLYLWYDERCNRDGCNCIAEEKSLVRNLLQEVYNKGYSDGYMTEYSNMSVVPVIKED